MLSVDGSSNMNDSIIGLVLTLAKGVLIRLSVCYGFRATNNEAKYEALFVGLSFAKDMGIWKLDVRSNSQLVVNQLLETYQAIDSKMTTYLAHVKWLQSSFEEFNIVQVPKLENGHADEIANLRLTILVTTSQSIPLLYL